MNQHGYYFLWNGIDPVERIDDAETLTDTPGKALAALKAKRAGHWTLWVREGNRAVIVAIWIPSREELHMLPIDCAELDGGTLP